MTSSENGCINIMVLRPQKHFMGEISSFDEVRVKTGAGISAADHLKYPKK